MTETADLVPTRPVGVARLILSSAQENEAKRATGKGRTLALDLPVRLQFEVAWFALDNGMVPR